MVRTELHLCIPNNKVKNLYNARIIEEISKYRAYKIKMVKIIEAYHQGLSPSSN